MHRWRAVLFFALVAATPPPSQAANTTVVVIGGGASGIAAALELQANNVDFVLLEARNVLGGRVRTKPLAGFNWSVGAAWIHGKVMSESGELNPIYELAAQANVPWSATDWENDTVRNRSGQVLDATLVDSWWRRVDNVSKYCKSKYDELWETDLSIPESVDMTIGACWDEFGFFDAAQTNESEDFAKFLQWSEADFEYTMRPRQLGLMWSLPPNADYNDIDHMVTGSYYEVLQSVASTLSAGAVMTGQKVTTVNYVGPGVQVMTEQGLSVNASAVICTLPLGVLQQRVVTWEPALPAAKLGGIDKMVMGAYEKAVLQFPSVFWDSTEVTYLAGDFKSGIVKILINRDHVKLNPGSKMIEIHFTGVDAQTIARGTAAEAQVLIMAELRSVFGMSIPNPTMIELTNWTFDPYTFGSYSAWPFGYVETEWTHMKGSLNDTVFFAGEHTNENYGFVHSAWESGKGVVSDSVLPALKAAATPAPATTMPALGSTGSGTGGAGAAVGTTAAASIAEIKTNVAVGCSSCAIAKNISDSPQATEAFQDSMSETLGIDKKHVKASTSEGGSCTSPRRLDEHESAPGRQLSTPQVNVAYTINVPPGPAVESVSSAVQAAKTQLTGKINMKMQAIAAFSSETLSVASISVPQVTLAPGQTPAPSPAPAPTPNHVSKAVGSQFAPALLLVVFGGLFFDNW